MDVTDNKALEAWLERQPREIIWLIAARAAWRVWPGLYYSYSRLNSGTATARVLPLLRGSASALVAGTCPTSADGRAAAAAAARLSAARLSAAADAADARLSAARLSAAADAAATAAAAAAAAADAAADAARLSAARLSAADAAAARFSATAAALRADAAAVDAGADARALSLRPLWPEAVPDWSKKTRDRFAEELLAVDPGFSVWIDFYDALIRGGPRPHDAAFARAIDDLALWDRPVAEINARLIELVEEERQKQREAAASPDFYANERDQIDIRPNTAFDAMPPGRKPADVLRQLLEVLASLDGTLDRNASSMLRLNVRRTRRHLVRRRLTPDLPTLRIQHALIAAEWNDSKGDGWATEGIVTAFDIYFRLHKEFVALPRDAETRDPQIAADTLNPAVVDDPNFARVLIQLEAGFKDLVAAEIATPPAGKAIEEIVAAGKDLRATPEDRFVPEGEVSPRKRYLFNLAGVTTTLKRLAPAVVITANMPMAWQNVLAAIDHLMTLIFKFLS